MYSTVCCCLCVSDRILSLLSVYFLFIYSCPWFLLCTVAFVPLAHSHIFNVMVYFSLVNVSLCPCLCQHSLPTDYIISVIAAAIEFSNSSIGGLAQQGVREPERICGNNGLKCLCLNASVRNIFFVCLF